MHRSAENKPVGKTVEQLAKRNAPNINKYALKITKWDDFHQTTKLSTILSYTVLTKFPSQSLHTSSSFFSQDLENRQPEDRGRRSEAEEQN